MKMCAEWFDALVNLAVLSYVVKAKRTPVEDVPDEVFVASETIGEVIDKLIILNIRIWHLEDQVDRASNQELLDIQRRLRHCFRVKRPRLVAALNQMLKLAIEQGQLDLVDDEDVKAYKGD